MRLTKHFTLEEFERSNTASRLGLDNTIPLTYRYRALRLAWFLEKLRQHTGPIRISSGYRGTALNKAVGGSKHSDHCTMRAVDIQIARMTPSDVASLIDSIYPLSSYRVMITEAHRATRWLHISLPKDNRRGMLLDYKNGHYRTIRGYQ